MKLFRVSFAPAVLFSVFLACCPAASQQPPSPGEDGGRKTSLAGRQRMLLQDMAKSACFAVLGVDADAHIRNLATAQAAFDRTLKDLTQGSEAQHLLPETDPEILAMLKRIASSWSRYSEAIKSVAEHYKDNSAEGALKTIYELNPGLVLDMTDAVTRFEDVHGHPGGARQAALSSAIGIADRQRMLSQKMAKEYCMTASRYKSGESRVFLLGTMALFELTQDWLAINSVDLDLTETETDYLFARKSRAERVWQVLRAVYAKAAAGAAPAREDLATAAVVSLELLSELNDVVKYYETLAAPQAQPK